MEKPILIPFDVWKILWEDEISPEEPCEYCDGTGEEECECCGHIVECEECDGRGVVNTPMDQYRDACKRALAKWEMFQGVMSEN